MENQLNLSNINEFLSTLLAYNSKIFPAYYDSEVRSKTEHLSKKFGTNIFIETGSFDGRNVTIVDKMDLYDCIHTVELQDSMYNNFVLPNTKNCKKVKCHLGNSAELLDQILSNLSKEDRCVVFLDAHGFQLPLVTELKLIAKYCAEKPPVIIIHDFFVPSESDPNRPKFPNLVIDDNNVVVKFDYIESYVNQIYGNNNYVVEYSTRSDLPDGGTGALYLYPKV